MMVKRKSLEQRIRDIPSFSLPLTEKDMRVITSYVGKVIREYDRTNRLCENKGHKIPDYLWIKLDEGILAIFGYCHRCHNQVEDRATYSEENT